MSLTEHRIDMPDETNPVHDIAVILDHIAKTHDMEVSIGLLDQLHPDRYRGDMSLAVECRAWLMRTPKPTLGQILVMGFLLNKGLVFMTRPYTDAADDDVAWGSLLESKQLASMTTKTSGQEAAYTVPALQTESDESDVAHTDADLSAFEQELHDMALQ